MVNVSVRGHQRSFVGLSYHVLNGFAFLPRYIDLEPTYRCNLRCDVCMFYGRYGILKDEEKTRELSLNELKGFIDELCAYKFSPYIALAGGEPFARKDTVQIMEHLKLKGFQYGVITNGTLLNGAIIRDVIKAEPVHMTFSIDGPERIHDRIRGVKGVFHRAIQAIQMIRNGDTKNKISLQIQCTISSSNTQYLEKMVELAKELGTSMRFQHLMFLNGETIKEQNNFDREYLDVDHDTFFNGLLTDSQDIDVEGLVCKVKEIRDLARDLHVKVDFNPNLTLEEIRGWYSDLEFKHCDRCLYPWFSVRISPYGDVYPCMEFYAGNILKSDFKSIYNNERMKYFRRTLKEHKLFPGCIRCCRLQK